MFPVAVLTTVTYWDFEISNVKLKKEIKLFVNMGAYGSENFKDYSYSYDSYSTKLFLNVSCDSRHKSWI